MTIKVYGGSTVVVCEWLFPVDRNDASTLSCSLLFSQRQKNVMLFSTRRRVPLTH